MREMQLAEYEKYVPVLLYSASHRISIKALLERKHETDSGMLDCLFTKIVDMTRMSKIFATLCTFVDNFFEICHGHFLANALMVTAAG